MSRFAGVFAAVVFIVLSYVNAATAAGEAHQNGTGLFVSADYNYKKLDEDTSGKSEPNWDSGFTVEAGYRTPDGGWDILGRYSYYRTSSGLITTGILTGPFSTTIIREKTDYDLDEAVIEGGYVFEVTDDLHFRPHLGAQYTRIEKTANFFVNTFLPPIINSRSSNNMEFQGYGLRAGTDFDYCIGSDLHLSGGISGGFLAGTVELSTLSLSREDDELVPMYDANLGLGYDIDLTETVCLNISAGYEFGEYFNLSNPRVFFDGFNLQLADDSTDYTVHGPYFRAGLYF